jgi:hypothetical protein
MVIQPVRPDVGANGDEPGVYEFVGDFSARIAQRVSAVCAAGRTRRRGP